MRRALLALICLAPLGGCFSYTDTSTPVVVQPSPAPATGTVVVQPN